MFKNSFKNALGIGLAFVVTVSICFILWLGLVSFQISIDRQWRDAIKSITPSAPTDQRHNIPLKY